MLDTIKKKASAALDKVTEVTGDVVDEAQSKVNDMMSTEYSVQAVDHEALEDYLNKVEGDVVSIVPHGVSGLVALVVTKK